MNPADVKRLMTVAVKTARVLGFGIADNCQYHMRSALQNASLSALPIAKGEPPPPFLDPSSMLLLAKARVSMYVSAMVTDAISTGIPPDKMLHENNFFGVKKWICPLWPMC